MSERDSFEKLLSVIRELREKCLWDREQTLASTAKHLIEEAYEAADALRRGEGDGSADELGDVLVQVLFAAVIGAQSGSFDVSAILEAARAKLIRRHPHVYGDVKAETVEEIVRNYDRIKDAERGGGGERSSVAAGGALPALMRAEKLGEHARRRGMDWTAAAQVLRKVREELDEAEEAIARGDERAARDEIGDMLLALANAPRFLGGSAEEVLRRACEKFVERFERAQKLAESRGLRLSELSADDVEALWQEAKRSRG
jgi:MazG family protein